jgi:dihydroorotase
MITLQSPLDMHVHFRQGEMLRRVAPHTADFFSGAVVMPNLVPPVDSLPRLLDYRTEVDAATTGRPFSPLMTLFFRNYTARELEEARPHLFAVKLYPAGATTNSEAGVREWSDADRVMSILQDLDIPLLVHGETAGFVMDRETEFLAVYGRIAARFPRLRIVMEHITTRAAVDMLDRHPNLHATVTLHHLLITLNDVAGGLLNPHLFCKPIAKRPEDRDALLQAALSAHPRIMFGSDSAPHPVSKKECCGCAAGVYTAPMILPCLCELFAAHGALDKLQDFVSGNAIRIHGLRPPKREVKLAPGAFTVPARYGDIVPFRAGETLTWTVV